MRNGVMTNNFDTKAIAVDLLDAYRAAELDAVLDLYDDEASIECGCDGQKILVGKEALRQYWLHLFAEAAVLELDDLQPVGESIALAYRNGGDLVRAVLSFNGLGKITRMHCGPLAEIRPLRPRQA